MRAKCPTLPNYSCLFSDDAFRLSSHVRSVRAILLPSHFCDNLSCHYQKERRRKYVLRIFQNALAPGINTETTRLETELERIYSWYWQNYVIKNQYGSFTVSSVNFIMLEPVVKTDFIGKTTIWLSKAPHYSIIKTVPKISEVSVCLIY